jgi:hypothetical protein
MTNLKHENVDGIDNRDEKDKCGVLEKHGNSFGALWCHNKREIMLVVYENFLQEKRNATLYMSVEQAKILRSQLTSFIRYSNKF